jgi:hypothetical protein
VRATALLARQLAAINTALHNVASDLAPDELTTRILPNTNLLAFDLWHIPRTQDWALQTLIRGAPELIDDPRWQGCGRLVTHGIGVGFTEAQADDLAHALSLPDILAYADATHQYLVDWLLAQTDELLDYQPNILPHLQRYPVYLEDAMRAEVPWMYEQPPVWRCLMPATNHARDHLAVMGLLKRQMRARAHAG